MSLFGVSLGPEAGFIIVAYALAGIVVAGLIAWIVADHRAQLRHLVDLEKRGATRRSQPRRQEAS